MYRDQPSYTGKTWSASISRMNQVDAFDEYLRLSETMAILCLENFVKGIISLFGDEYLRRPTPEDLQRLLDIGELRGFPGMIGSIDVCIGSGRIARLHGKVNIHEALESRQSF
ncbi:PREDICTED: uncharacterized protein LOC109130016 [Camelina sativa]|uniref:Uncharacterized protein LOC109130016 n=1 Tax=Camelina sativa TaxID=90675 RepID=A0ABM1R6S1_CAMSA|nr:PREDICTED: uncharacterized protein LOC109130016 [Camelina sativa]XP_019094709.1 PREDICTED: uncharacterized protein LOC109130016 [Camelina sativa]